MSRTRPVLIIGLAAVAAVLGFVVESVLVATGRLAYAPPLPLGIVLATIGAILVILAWPVRQVSRGNRPSASVGFRHATNVLSFAKASIVLGALLAGAGGGILTFVLTRPTVASGMLLPSFLAIGGAAVLLVAGLVAESWCALPPEDSDGAAAAG